MPPFLSEKTLKFEVEQHMHTESEVESETETFFSSSSPPPPWIELPGDVTANILQRLGAKEILESAQFVCTTWRKVCLDPAMWRVIELECMPWDFPPDFLLICRCVVDRSQGQLIDLRIAGFGDDDLLHYIADHSRYLQRLTISNTYDLWGTALSKSVKKLPQLVELNLIMLDSVRAKDIEAIGISCPTLKSFSYHRSKEPMYPLYGEPKDSKHCNKFALAIGKGMPNLRHLQLLGNWMKNEGLEAILDGCPCLESLDIRKCSGLDLTGALGKRCCQQIKNLRDPCEPISDFEWLGISSDGVVHWSNDASICSNWIHFSDASYSDSDSEYDDDMESDDY